MMANSRQSGFTLIEMLISLFIASVLLAGLYVNFWAGLRIQTTQTQYTERLQDLRLAAQIMANALRLAANASITVNTGAGTNINYNDQHGNAGIFKFEPTDDPPSLCWDIPAEGSGCQELIRDLDSATGMVVDVAGGVLHVTLTASYLGSGRQQVQVPIEFRVWPRN